ncbi:MAG: hypothetical protein JNJ57_16780 [Saprospiraceae bacterium]|nr:hypothetical protein [Saprospiraceae bacterium]
MKLYLLFLIACCCGSLRAQQLAHHDILLLQFSKASDGNWQTSAPKFLTAFNPKGYNNQPKFFSDNELWLTVQTPKDTTQTDIYALDLGLKTFTRVTETPKTAEYSPTPMPGGKRFSAVRVEEDDNQRLWSFPIDRSDNGRPEFPDLYGVGYHCWLNDTLVAFFIVGDEGQPHTLQVAGTRRQQAKKLASNIGRCLLKTSDGKLAFVQKPTEQTWFLKTWTPASNQQDIVVKMPAGVEDFAILPDGTYLCGDGARLYVYKAGMAEWKEMGNLGKHGVKKITRIAASRDGKVAVVVE